MEMHVEKATVEQDFIELAETTFAVLEENGFIADRPSPAPSSLEEDWSKIMEMDPPCIDKKVKKANKVDVASSMPEDWDLEFPVLRLRKDIWENFPVQCTPLGRGADGAERHAIVWHRKNFTEWRDACEDYFEAMDYEEITTYRLFKCLEASKFWTVEPAQTSQYICILRMNFSEETAPTVAPVAPVAPVAVVHSRQNGLVRINDITSNFPVVWDNVTCPGKSARSRDIIAITPFNKKIREIDPRTVTDILDRLMNALRASGSWRVLRGEGREVCRLEIA